MKTRAILLIAAGAVAAVGVAIGAWLLLAGPQPKIAYAPEQYQCEISASGRTASFKLRFSFEVVQSAETIALSIKSRPEASELWTDAGIEASSLDKGLGDMLVRNFVAAPKKSEGKGPLFDFPSLASLTQESFAATIAYDRSKVPYKNDLAFYAMKAAFAECMADALSIVGGDIAEDEATRVAREGERATVTREKAPWIGAPDIVVAKDEKTVLDAKGFVIDRVATATFGEEGAAYGEAQPPIRLAYRIYRSSAAADAIPPLAELPRQWYQRKSDAGSGFPRVDGSTATIPLTAALVSRLYGYSVETAKTLFKHNKTHDAYVNLIDGKADLIFVTEPSREELAFARERGVQLVVKPVTREAFVFLVNTANSVESLTVEDLRAIYSGSITNWESFGIMYGANTRIAPLFREPNSGSQTLFEKFIMPTADIVIQPSFEIEGMGELIESVANSAELLAAATVDEDDNDSAGSMYGAIGFSVYYYATEMKANPSIRLIAIDGVEPNDETILDGSYPFITGYYAVYRKNDAPKSVQDLLYWITFPAGADTLRKAHYLPYSDVKK